VFTYVLEGRFSREKARVKKGKTMSNSTQQKTESKTSRVQVGNLPQQEKELKDQEAEKVKGGGGARCSGEEIPQTTLK
jgi:hypothetical protein